MTRIPASFHCSTIVSTAACSQVGSGLQMISMSMPFGIAGLGQELLRSFDVALHLRELEVFRMDRRDMVMLADLAEALVRDLQHWLGVGGEPEGLADLWVVERLVVAAHAGNARLRRWRDSSSSTWSIAL